MQTTQTKAVSFLSFTFTILLFIVSTFYAQNISASPDKFDYEIKYDPTTNKAILVNHIEAEIKKGGNIKWEAVKKNDVPAGSKIVTEFKIMFYTDANKQVSINCKEIIHNSSQSCKSGGFAESNAQKIIAQMKCKLENCNGSTDPNEKEEYWFNIYDIKLEDKDPPHKISSTNDIDPKIVIKNQ